MTSNHIGPSHPASHPQSSGVQNFGVSGEMHLGGSVIVQRHRHLLQGSVPAVRTEHLRHAAGRPADRGPPQYPAPPS